MRTWDVFFPDVLPDVLGCPEPTVERHLLRAAIDFCTRARVWRQDLDRIITRDGRADYDISWPDQAQGVELIGATLDGDDIDLEVADGTTAGQRQQGTSGRRRVLSQDLVTATVMPTPGEGQVLVLAAILCPSEDATGVPDIIGDRFRKAIATGALQTLLKINKAPWANAGLSTDKGNEFDKAIAQAASKMWRANTNKRPRVRGQFY
jgi:hypothetical protein